MIVLVVYLLMFWWWGSLPSKKRNFNDSPEKSKFGEMPISLRERDKGFWDTSTGSLCSTVWKKSLHHSFCSLKKEIKNMSHQINEPIYNCFIVFRFLIPDEWFGCSSMLGGCFFSFKDHWQDFGKCRKTPATLGPQNHEFLKVFHPQYMGYFHL